jgi:hypothetical protein
MDFHKKRPLLHFGNFRKMYRCVNRYFKRLNLKFFQYFLILVKYLNNYSNYLFKKVDF